MTGTTTRPARPPKAPLTTRTLLTCVAIAVASGLLAIGPAYLSGATSAAFPPAFQVVCGIQLFPSIVALRLLSRGGVGLFTSALVGLIGVVTGPYGWGSMAVLMFGVLSEVPFLVNRYRRWATWRFLLAAVLSGAVYTPSLFLAYDYAALARWVQVLTLVLPTLSMLGFAVLGLLAAAGLRRAGVGPQPRVRADDEPAGGDAPAGGAAGEA